MKKQLCFETEAAGFPIRLEQTGVDRFTVTYGKQIRRGLDYKRAALDLGAAIMHAAACEGKLDNREKGEA
jgi:hypothetical protein